MSCGLRQYCVIVLNILNADQYLHIQILQFLFHVFVKPKYIYIWRRRRIRVCDVVHQVTSRFELQVDQLILFRIRLVRFDGKLVLIYLGCWRLKPAISLLPRQPSEEEAVGNIANCYLPLVKTLSLQPQSTSTAPFGE